MAVKTYNCKTAIVLVALAFAFSPIYSHAQQKPKTSTTLTLEDVLACGHGPSMQFLKMSVDQIRAMSTKTEGQTSYYDRQVEIHWLDDADEADILSLSERKFCSSASLQFVSVPQGLKTVRYVSSIHRIAGRSYTLSLQQVYAGSRAFLQEQGVVSKPAKRILTVTLEPIQCDIRTAGEDGVFKTSKRTWKSKIGVSLQWEKGKNKNEWVFYQAIYGSPGCD